MKFACAAVLVTVLLAPSPAAFAGEAKVLDDFEDGRINWTGQFRGSIVAEYATHGRNAFKVVFPVGVEYPGISASRIDLDWSGFDVLKIDVFNPQGAPVDLTIRIDDPRSTGYSSRYNGEFLITNGQTFLEIPLNWLRAGDRPLDTSAISAFVIFMSSPDRDTVLYFDNIRLVKGQEPPESGPRVFEEEAEGAGVRELERKARTAAARLGALIELAHRRGIGTLEANMALITADLGLDVRPELAWFRQRKPELYDYVERSCNDAAATLRAQLEETISPVPVPPIHNTAALAASGPHFVERTRIEPRPPQRPVLIFSMLYLREGPLCEYFTPIDYFVHSHSFAGASRYDVERTPLYKAYHAHDDTHRVWNDDEGWCGHIVRDSASLGGGSGPVVVCLESPHTKKAIEQYINEGSHRWKGRDEVLLNILGGELSYICYCPYTLSMFREYLKGRHGSIEALNEIWETQHGSFDEITVMPNASQAGENRARWYDWQSFNCRRFVEHAKWAKSVIRRIDADIPVALGAVSYSFTPGLGRSGVDEETLIREVDDIVLNESGPSTITTDLLRSLSEGDRPMVDFEYHGDVAGLLPHFLHGNAAMAMWWWPGRPDTEFPQFNRTALPFSWEIPLSDVAECLKIALDVRRIGPEIALFARQPAEMAILYSRASMLQVEEEFLSLTESPYTLELKNVYDAMLGLDAPVRFVSSTQVTEGKLAGLKVLVVPAAKYVIDGVAERIFEFAQAGGTVVVTPASFLFDEYARPREHLGRLGISVTDSVEPKFAAEQERHEFLQEFIRRAKALDLPRHDIELVGGDLLEPGTRLRGQGTFQVLRHDIRTRVIGLTPQRRSALLEVPYGEGRFYYLATTLAPESLNSLLHAIATKAAVSRPVSFRTAGGKRHWRLEGRAVVRGGAALFYLTNHGDEPIGTEVELPFAAGRFTDLRDPRREVDPSRISVAPGRTRILAAREEAPAGED
ncbi:MAG: beta-galactosidase trimerization domain-containing protein [Planctomycetota bacterium]|jgi:hypothetical protein